MDKIREAVLAHLADTQKKQTNAANDHVYFGGAIDAFKVVLGLLDAPAAAPADDEPIEAELVQPS